MKNGWRIVLPVLLIPVLFGMHVIDAAAREEITISSGRTVDDVFIFGKDVRIYGTVDGDAVVFGGDIFVENGGYVEGDAVVFLGDVFIRSDAGVEGDVVTIGGSPFIDAGGEYDGTIVDIFPGGPFRRWSHGMPGIVWFMLFGPFVATFGVLGMIIGISLSVLKILITLGFAAVVASLFPAQVAVMAGCTRRRYLRALLVGIVSFILVPFLLLGLIVTIIGIPLVPALILALIVVCFYGSVGVALAVGRFFPNSEGRSQMRNVVIGVLTLALIKLIPGLGLAVGVLVAVLSLGVTLLARFGTATGQSA